MSEIPTVLPTDLPDDALVIDVREHDEWIAGHAPGAVHLPLGDIPARLDELPTTDESLPIVCRSGGRSGRAVQWLVQQGFDVVNVEGGMKAWHASGKAMTSETGGEPHVV
ncbi:rhodanese-like domain-containing protein [Ornithinimicrobium cerasi]|uniref:Rhodanese-related sulfurtransferase n=1 Tax=Ornithinimicrobium cerasi TaxID=2248773 RepID=A0A285VUF6_9MICO|nr:rhodanese-like domain-containing protein [Ornithinimicrobium cerasi]SOC57527.1 Rhodanese-related sulfurtransferase [Ornithinimicrobium cerasi]SOC57609.1 Rhodanese-related sulfurtransferase [Ornithinimicrobium cerasi]